MSRFIPEIATFFKQLFEFVVMALGIALIAAYVVIVDSAGLKTFGERDWALLSKRMDSSKEHRKLSDRTKRRLRRKATRF